MFRRYLISITFAVLALTVAVLLGTVHASLPGNIVDDLRSSDAETRSRAARQLASDLYSEATGKELPPKQYITLVWQEADLTPHPGRELIAGLTLIPEEGYLGLYGRTAGGYRLLSYVPNLSAIETIKLTPIAPDTIAIEVTDLYDESLGAFLVQRMTHLFRWNEKTERLHSIWQTVTYLEEYSLDPPLEEKRVLKASFRIENGIIELTETVTDWKKEGDDYRLTDRATTTRRYTWNEQLFQFIQQPAQD